MTDSNIKTASWVIVDKNGAAVLETHNKRIADTINTEKYRAVPILEYLCGLNNNG